MSSKERKQHQLTRRGFIRHSSALGAGVALGPLVLDLTGCGSDDAPATGTKAPPTAADTAGSSAAATSPTSASSAAGSSAAATSSAAGSNAGKPTQSPSSAAGSSSMAQNTPSSSGSAGQSQATPASSGAPPSGMTGAQTPPAMNGNAIAAGAVLMGLYKGDGVAAVTEAVKRLDFSWLKQGDTVLIKVATNSQYKHPTTTSPNGVKALVMELKTRGAAKVIIGDQAGVEHVRLSKMGRNGKTTDMWSMSGMMDAMADAEPHAFDDQAFDTGYFSATLPPDNHWPRGMYIPSVIKEVDHIIYMPRIGTHMLAGNTISHKSAIGWLRDDSRHDLHNDAMNYYEKYTEVNYTKEIQDRLRMVVTVSEAILLHGGPDTGTVYALDPVMVTASTSLANHDAVASSVLVTLNKNVTKVDPGTMTYNPSSAPQNNAFFANGAGVVTGDAGPWTSGSTQSMYTAHPFEMGVSKDRAIARGWALQAGGKPAKIQVVIDGAQPDDMLKAGLMTHGEGMYELG